jgi:hypothetical protein
MEGPPPQTDAERTAGALLAGIGQICDRIVETSGSSHRLHFQVQYLRDQAQRLLQQATAVQQRFLDLVEELDAEVRQRLVNALAQIRGRLAGLFRQVRSSLSTRDRKKRALDVDLQPVATPIRNAHQTIDYVLGALRRKHGLTPAI